MKKYFKLLALSSLVAAEVSETLGANCNPADEKPSEADAPTAPDFFFCNRASECCGDAVPWSVADNAAQTLSTDLIICNRKDYATF